MRPLTVAWITDFPLEWLPEMPEPIPRLPKEHPATWEMVLLEEFEKNKDVRLHVIALRKNIERSFSFQRRGTDFHVVKYWGGVRGPSLFWCDTWLVRKALLRTQPDLVHAWGNERGAGLVASRLRWPYLVTIQGLFTWYREALPEYRGIKLPAWAESTSLKRARHATTESSFSTAYLRSRYPRLTVHQAEHAPNPLFATVKRRPRLQPIRFLTNGTISLRKGTDLFLKSLSALMDDFVFEAIVIGSPNPELIEPLRASLPAAMWERVTFKAGLSPREVAEELAETTIFVLPTRADTSPNAVKEAVVSGTPVVASAVGGVPDYVSPGLNGFTFPPGDLHGLINALRQACVHPRFGKGEVEEATLAQKRDYLSPRRMGANFLAAYQAARRDHGGRNESAI